MSVPNIEVRRDGPRWRWHILAPCGRDLVSSQVAFDCDLAAFTAAKGWRARFQAVADVVDGWAA